MKIFVKHKYFTICFTVVITLVIGISCCSIAKRDIAFEKQIQSFVDNSIPGSEINLFNGEDLGGWSVHGVGSWSVNEGVLSVRRGLGYLATRCDSFEDIVISLEVRISEWGNSGVFIRSEHPESIGRPWPQGYEAQIYNYKSKYPTGSIYNLIPASSLVSKNNEWFTMEVISNGSYQQVSVNGSVVSSVTDESYTNGFIALQAHDPWSIAEFRNIKVKIPN